MIEFTLSRVKSGKKSRWAKKYPRKRILKKGSEKAAGWYFHNWYDDDYHYFRGDLHKFLLANVGRPVDKAFSEFLQRCRKGTEKYNLRKWFYDMFEEKEDIGYTGGFYLSNGIINYKKRRREPKRTLTFQSPLTCVQFNIHNFPNKRRLYSICKEAERTHSKRLLGTFYILDSHYKRKKATVYVATKEDYESSYFYMRIIEIVEVGMGVNFYIYNSQNRKEDVDIRYISRSWNKNQVLPEYVFLIKENL